MSVRSKNGTINSGYTSVGVYDPNDGSSHIRIVTPANNSVYYLGETIPLSVQMKNPWANYGYSPYLEDRIAGSSSSFSYWQSTYFYTSSAWQTFQVNWNLTGSHIAGKYELWAFAYAYNKTDGKKVTSVNPMTVKNTFTVKKLQPPGSFKVTAGSGKATLTWTAAEGAQKYYIYRSTKSDSGFSMLGQTSNLKYTDTSAASGKRYYYKVKSVRNKYGEISSSFTAVKVKQASGSIKLNRSTLSLKAGSSSTLKATVTGGLGSVSWSSSNKAVAAVNSSGKVTAKKAGTATITAKAGGKTASCKVTVTSAVPAWRTAYKNALKNLGFINTSNRFALIYIDNNAVPEMVVIDDASAPATVNIFSYNSSGKKAFYRSKQGVSGLIQYRKKTGYYCYTTNGTTKLIYCKFSNNKFSQITKYETNGRTYRVNGSYVNASTYSASISEARKNMITVTYSDCYACTSANVNKIVNSPSGVMR